MAQIAKEHGVTIADVLTAMSEMPRNPSVEEFVRIMKKAWHNRRNTTLT
jgi:hypothetical protein